MDNPVLRGWTVSGIVTYQKGLPFSVTDSTTGGIFGATGAGTAQFLCTRIRDAYTTGSTQARLDHYLNPACFGTAPLIPGLSTINGGANAGATGFGNTPRNAFRAPYQQNWDIS